MANAQPVHGVLYLRGVNTALTPGLVFRFPLLMCKSCFLPSRVLPPTVHQCNNGVSNVCTEKDVMILDC